jgi:hypothetical protein
VGAVPGSDVRVLYVLGIYHSGTTVLSNLVGQRDGFFSAGELRHLWPKLALGGYRCGCGEPLEACPVWSEILRSALGEGADHVLWARQMWQWQREVLRKHHTWAAVPGLLRRRGFSQESPAGRYASALARFYRAIADVTGCEVIVDSSKEASDAALLLRIPEIDASFAQIVRDPRGLVYSLLRNQADGRPVTTSQWRPAVYAALSWDAGNLAAVAVRRSAGPGRSMLLRYEDFVARPHETVTALSALAGKPARVPQPAGGPAGTVTLNPTHTAGGNNNRFRTGEIRLREDTEWRSGLHRLDRATVTALCLPLMKRYGY